MVRARASRLQAAGGREDAEAGSGVRAPRVCSAAERLPAGGGDGGGGARELCPAHAAGPGPAAAAAAWGAVLAAARGAKQPAREEPGAAHHQVRVFAAGGAGRRPGPQSGERRLAGTWRRGDREAGGCRMRGPPAGRRVALPTKSTQSGDQGPGTQERALCSGLTRWVCCWKPTP